MTRRPCKSIDSRCVVLATANIDTDQIIPARFLTTTERVGLGQHAFADWRGVAEFSLDDPRAADCEILVAGDNFGCGSSREHAPWALLDCGLRAVVSTSFADIFRQNAHKNGLLTVQVEPDLHRQLLAGAWQPLFIDVQAGFLRLPDGSTSEFPLDPFTRHCLCNGVDELAYLLEFESEIEAFERRHTT